MCVLFLFVFFFFKQKTAYEMRISDWSSDVCSSDLQEFLMALRPLHDRVIVKRLDNERKTASGIVIPDSAAEKPDQGEVVAVGPGKKTEDGKVLPVDLKAGDKVLFGKYAGQAVKVDGEELLVIREEEMLAVIQYLR